MVILCKLMLYREPNASEDLSHRVHMTEILTRPSLDMEEIQSSSNLITVISPRGIMKRSTIQKSLTSGEERGAT